MEDTIDRKEAYRKVNLTALITEATLAPNRSIPDDVHSIDLGKIGAIAEGMLDRSLADKHARERGRKILLDPRTKDVVLSQEDIVGSGEQVEYTVSYQCDAAGNAVKRDSRTKPFFVGTIHTHSIHDLPVSPKDVELLLVDPEYPSSKTATILVTHQRKTVIFRGKNSPRWNRERAKANIKLWNEDIDKKARKRLKSNMSDEERLGINAVVNQQFVRFLKNKYDLRIFSTSIENNVVTRETS